MDRLSRKPALIMCSNFNSTQLAANSSDILCLQSWVELLEGPRKAGGALLPPLSASLSPVKHRSGEEEEAGGQRQGGQGSDRRASSVQWLPAEAQSTTDTHTHTQTSAIWEVEVCRTVSVYALICTGARIEDFIVASLMVSSVVSTLSFGSSLTRRDGRRGAIKQNGLEQKKKVLADGGNTLNIEHQGEDEVKSAQRYFFSFFFPLFRFTLRPRKPSSADGRISTFMLWCGWFVCE